MHLSLTTFALLLAILPANAKNQYSHFPSVPKWYVFNGLLDKFFDESSPCVQECIKSKATFGDILSLPCPRWDVGCFCVMPPFNQHWLNCVSENCPENSVETHEKALAQCEKAGVTWGDKLYILAETLKLLEKAKESKQEKMVPPLTKMIIEANGKTDTSKALEPEKEEEKKTDEKKEEDKKIDEKKEEDKKIDEKKEEDNKTDVESMSEGKSAPSGNMNEEAKAEAKSGPSEDKKEETSIEAKKSAESKSKSSMAPQSSEMTSSKQTPEQSLAEISNNAKTESSSVVSAATTNTSSTKAPEIISSSNSGVALQVAIAPIMAVVFMAML